MSNEFDHIGNLTREKATERLNNCPVGLLPVGSIEQHGPHLPIDTDAYDAFWVARNVLERVSHPRPVVLPPMYYGVSPHHMDFSPTLSIDPETLSNLVMDVGRSFQEHGGEALIMVNGHGGNVPALKTAARKLSHELDLFSCVNTGSFMGDTTEIVETKGDVHAGETETSTSLANRPGRVLEDQIPEQVTVDLSSKFLEYRKERGVSFEGPISDISETGVLGNPTKATAEKGEKLWERELSGFASFLEDVKTNVCGISSQE